MKHRKIWAALAGVVLLSAAVAAFCAVDLQYDLSYTVSAPAVKPNTLEVVLEARSTPFSRGRTLSLYIGDKDVTLKSCTGGDGLRLEARQTEDAITFDLGRNSRATLVYEVPLGATGKHGQRGAARDAYCVFDGGQALALPMEFYEDGFPQDKAVVRGLRVTLKPRDGWTAVPPFEELRNVVWADAYDLNSDAFAMGDFALCAPAEETGGAEVYCVQGEASYSAGVTAGVTAGVSALRGYYRERFGEEQPYKILLLPDGEEDVIGGAGVHSVCATFDENDRRDWELLSHRMFHAYFDSTVRTQTFHAAPNLWFYEGLATYYENASMGALPQELRAALDIRPEWQFNSLFNRYLYIRLKDLALFSFAPMDEAEISESEGRKEFLHYIQAPLVVKLVEDRAQERTGQKDAILNAILAEKGSEFAYMNLLTQLLGDEAGAMYNRYFKTDELLPVWDAASPDYPEQRAVDDIEDVEVMIATWMTQQLGQYPCDLPDLEAARKLESSAAFQAASFAGEETEALVQAHCPVVWTLLKQYALRAQVCGVPFDDPMLRYRLLADEAG